jgi:hypothetical protein
VIGVSNGSSEAAVSEDVSCLEMHEKPFTNAGRAFRPLHDDPVQFYQVVQVDCCLRRETPNFFTTA